MSYYSTYTTNPSRVFHNIPAIPNWAPPQQQQQQGRELERYPTGPHPPIPYQSLSQVQNSTEAPPPPPAHHSRHNQHALHHSQNVQVAAAFPAAPLTPYWQHSTSQSYQTNNPNEPDNTRLSYPLLSTPHASSPPLPETYTTYSPPADYPHRTRAPKPSLPATSLAAYQPPTSQKSYEERHKISDHVLKRFEQKQQVLPHQSGHSISEHQHSQNGNNDPQARTWGTPTYNVLDDSYPVGNTPVRQHSAPTPTSIGQPQASHYTHAAVSQGNGFSPPIKQEPAPYHHQNMMFIIPPSSTNARQPQSTTNLTPIASMLTDAVMRGAALPVHIPNSIHNADTPPLSSSSSSPRSTSSSSGGGPSPQNTGGKVKASSPRSIVSYSPYQREREKQPAHRVDTARLAVEAQLQSVPASVPPQIPIHQTISLTDPMEESKSESNDSAGKEGQKKEAKPFLACEFCRLRKIACGPGPTLPPDVEVPPGPRTCNQCHRRGHVCKFPEASRRGLRHGKPSRKVVYGPDNLFRIVDTEGVDDADNLGWNDILNLEQQQQQQKNSQRGVATMSVLSSRRAGGNSAKYPTRSTSPIRFVPAVDTELLKDLVATGRIASGVASTPPAASVGT